MNYYFIAEGIPTGTACTPPQWAGTYDIIVVGLGTAGAQCACTAANQYGMKVLGVEELTQLGGTATAGEITEYYCGNKGGLYQKIDAQAAMLEAVSGFCTNAQGISGWAKHLTLAQKLTHKNVTLLFDHVIAGVWREKNRIIGVRIVDGTGEQKDFCSAYVVDCTGDGIVCNMAGCPMQLDNCALTPFQPFSNIRIVLTENGPRCCNVDSGYTDPQDPWACSNAILHAAAMPNFYQQDYSQGDPLLYNAPILGVREGRRIVGEKVLRFQDILENTFQETPAFYAYSNMDNHTKATAFESSLYQDWIVAAGMWSVYLKFPVPFEIMIPKGFTGILAAGRILSADHDAACALRMKDEMYKSGETAACLAFLSLAQNLPARQLPYQLVHQALLQTGCIRNEEVPLVRGNLGNDKPAEVYLPVSQQAFDDSLASPAPGISLWALTQNADLRPPIAGLTASEKHRRFHSAIALALQGNPVCEEVVREMILDYSGSTLKNSKKFFYPYGIIGIYLAGRLKLANLTEVLLQILVDAEIDEKIRTLETDLCTDAPDIRFQYFTYSLTALFRISEANTALRKKVIDLANRQLRQQEFFLSLGSVKLRANESIQAWILRCS